MSRRGPRVSIGLPVYNGERYLRSAVDSILAQTFADFELIMCDNASTDGTEAIARGYAARDERVRYHRNEANLGANRNFNLTFQHASGEYFKWAAADDELDPSYLACCVQVLDRQPSVLLCHSQVRIIDEAGRTTDHHRYPEDHATASRPSRRFRDVLFEDRWCYEVFGLVRVREMRKTRLLDRFVGSDRILRAELALRGRYYIVPEPLFLNRDHGERCVRALPAHHMRGGWVDPSLAGRRILPHWRIFVEYLRCLQRVPIGPTERNACYVALGRWLGQHRNWARLGVDLVIAAAPSSGPFFLRTTGSAESWLPAQRPQSTKSRGAKKPR